MWNVFYWGSKHDIILILCKSFDLWPHFRIWQPPFLIISAMPTAQFKIQFTWLQITIAWWFFSSYFDNNKNTPISFNIDKPLRPPSKGLAPQGSPTFRLGNPGMLFCASTFNIQLVFSHIFLQCVLNPHYPFLFFLLWDIEGNILGIYVYINHAKLNPLILIFKLKNISLSHQQCT